MSVIEAEDQAIVDAEEVLRLVTAGKRVTDPKLLARVRERGERITEEIYKAHGTLEIAVDLIREARDE